jgi:hypothetical protein
MKRRMKLIVLPLIAVGTVAVLGVLIWLGYATEWTGFRQYTGPIVDKSQTFTRAKTLWDWLQLLIIPVALALGVFWLNHEDAKRQQRFARQLEQHRVLLERGSHLYEMQVAALLGLREKLHEANYLLQRATSPAIFSDEEKPKLIEAMMTSIHDAYQRYSHDKLLLAPEIVALLEEFFAEFQKARQELNWAMWPQTPNGLQRAKHWDGADQLAVRILPQLLEKFERESRNLIHQRSASTEPR